MMMIFITKVTDIVSINLKQKQFEVNTISNKKNTFFEGQTPKYNVIPTEFRCF